MVRKDFKLYVECMTYNQHQFITDTMNGFVMQKTLFPFVCCIVDDASTDGEGGVLDAFFQENFDLTSPSSIFHQETSYGYINYGQHKENKNCYFLIILLKENHYQTGRDFERLKYIEEWIGKPPYVATCEGDDYWIHPDKLQIQIDYLDKHPEFILSCHKSYICEDHEKESKMYLRPFDEDDSIYNGQDTFEYSFEDFFVGGKWINETNATIYRNVYDPYYWKNCEYTRDVHMIFYLLKRGKGVCHNFIGGVYRYNNGSIFAVLDRKRRAETMNGVYSEIYNQTHEPLIVNSLIHSRFVMLQCHVYHMKLDSFTLKAWKRYILYLINNTIHSLIPKRFRRSLKNQRQ